MYTDRPVGFWRRVEKLWYNEDATMKESFKQQLLAEGKSLEYIEMMERVKQKELAAYHRKRESIQKNLGISYEEWRRTAWACPGEAEARTREAIRNGEEISSLPSHVDPDEYYNS